MKKAVTLVLLFTMVLSLVACTTTEVENSPSQDVETGQPSGITVADLGIEPLVPDGETILEYSNSEWATVSELLDTLTDEDLAAVQEQNLTSVICIHENASY